MFDPLRAIRVIRDDQELTSTEKLLLLTAVSRTSKSGRVRASQQMLADDAAVTVRTVKTFYRGTSFTYYFNAEKVGRQVNLTWNEQTDIYRGSDRGSDRCTTFTPSISISTTTSTKTYMDKEEAIRAANLEADEKMTQLRLELVQ